jgi:methyl-accepting chemotaxis protein
VKLLNRLNIKAKLALLLGMSTAVLVVTLALGNSFLHQRMMDDRIAQLHSMVDAVHAFATELEARNVQQAASGTQDASRNIDGVSKAVEKSGSTATDVLAAADDLAEQSQALRREVDQFLMTVRAA